MWMISLIHWSRYCFENTLILATPGLHFRPIILYSRQNAWAYVCVFRHTRNAHMRKKVTPATHYLLTLPAARTHSRMHTAVCVRVEPEYTGDCTQVTCPCCCTRTLTHAAVCVRVEREYTGDCCITICDDSLMARHQLYICAFSAVSLCLLCILSAVVFVTLKLMELIFCTCAGNLLYDVIKRYEHQRAWPVRFRKQSF